MSIPKRGVGVPTRGSSSTGGGGSVVVGVDDDSQGNILSSNVNKIIWATDDLGFTATVHPDNPNTIVIGAPPQFEPPLSWSNIANTQARVAESDINEPDPFIDLLANTVVNSTNDSTPSWVSTLGRGLGPTSQLIVFVDYNGVEIDRQVFNPSSNGTTTLGNVSVTVSEFSPDGDGSSFQGGVAISVDINGVTGGDISAHIQVSWVFREQNLGGVINFFEELFYDKNSNTPIITGGTSVREHDTPASRVTKFLSGIQYYTTGSLFTLEVLGVDNHNNDTSHPDASLLVNPELFAISPYTSSPWVQVGSWNNISNLDSAQGFNYIEDVAVNVTNYRHIGNSFVGNVVRDSWNAQPSVDSNILSVAIDTVDNPSTQLIEFFDSENMRLESDYTTAWDSAIQRPSGHGIVFGGGFYHGADLPSITENTLGTIGSLGGDMSPFLPNTTTTGNPAVNPDYSVHNTPAVFFRQFLSPDPAEEHPTVNMTIDCQGDLSALLASNDIQIFIWKLDSSDPTSSNLVLPSVYNPTFPNLSKTGSLWGHRPYNFLNFDDGVSQTSDGSGMVSLASGNTLTLTFGGFNVIRGFLVRFEITQGTVINQVSVTFN